MMKVEGFARARGQLHLVAGGRDEGWPENDRAGWFRSGKEASAWFCDPVAFGHALRKNLLAHGLNPADFHQEPDALKRPPAETKKPLETGAFGAKTWRKRRDSNSGGCYTRRFSRPLP